MAKQFDSHRQVHADAVRFLSHHMRAKLGESVYDSLAQTKDRGVP